MRGSPIPPPVELEQDITGDWIIIEPEAPDLYVPDDLRERIHKKIWRTRDGTEVLIKDMKRLHLLRTINFIRRTSHPKHPATIEYIRLMQAELHRREPDVFTAP